MVFGCVWIQVKGHIVFLGFTKPLERGSNTLKSQMSVPKCGSGCEDLGSYNSFWNNVWLGAELWLLSLRSWHGNWGETFYEIFVSCSIGNNLSYKQPNLTPPSEMHRLKINPNRLSVGVHSIGFEVLRQHARKISISYMSTVGMNE